LQQVILFLMKLQRRKLTNITFWPFHNWQCTCPICAAKSFN
jgi:hypothetical protein